MEMILLKIEQRVLRAPPSMSAVVAGLVLGVGEQAEETVRAEAE